MPQNMMKANKNKACRLIEGSNLPTVGGMGKKAARNYQRRMAGIEKRVQFLDSSVTKIITAVIDSGMYDRLENAHADYPPATLAIDDISKKIGEGDSSQKNRMELAVFMDVLLNTLWDIREQEENALITRQSLKDIAAESLAVYLQLIRDGSV